MVVKRTAMGKQLWFFFTMFSTSGDSYHSIVLEGYVPCWLGFDCERFIVLLYLCLDWNQFVACCFVLIRVGTSIGYELRLAFCSVSVIICSSKMVECSSYA
jgi:hypothetical protein